MEGVFCCFGDDVELLADVFYISFTKLGFEVHTPFM
jgi:hypothetical protein